MKNFREIEHLSSYLDGQLSESESKRLETRLASDAELVSVLNDLRAARGILRKLPKRKAPRNFTLTRQIVGLKPPLPRTYPIFRFATVFASLMLMLSLTVNAMSPYVSFGAPTFGAYGFGGGGSAAAEEMAAGGGCEGPCPEPAAEAAPMLEMPSAEAQEDAAREEEPSMDTMQAPKELVEPESGLQDQPSAQSEAPFSVAWQIGLLAIAILGGALMWFTHRAAIRKWQ